MKPKRGWIGRALVAVVAVAVPAASLVPRAGAVDLDTLRERAQAVAGQVSELEHRLASLNSKKRRLDDAIAQASRDIGVIELEITALQEENTAARERFIERAILAYKAGSTAKLAVLLSARDVNDFITLAHATEQAQQLDQSAITDLTRSQAALEAAQNRIDERKQRLLSARNEANALGSQIQNTLSERRRVLEQLNAQVERLEEQARRLAARQAAKNDVDVGAALKKVLEGSGPAPGIPDEFVGTGVRFEGIASWYGPGFEGNPTASGEIFDPDLFTAASKELPLGTWLYVVHGSKGVVVRVNDRGPYIEGRILDLSEAAAKSIGITGLGWIKAEIIIRAR